MVSTAFSATLLGIDAVLVGIESQVAGGLRRFSLVGLPDGVLRESKDRIRCAIENSGFGFPEGEVIVSLGPASLPKYGSGFDLGIALSLLAACGHINKDEVQSRIVLGELSLDGHIKPVPGVLSALTLAVQHGKSEVLVAKGTSVCGIPDQGVRVIPVGSVQEAVLYLRGEVEIEALDQQEQVASESIAYERGFGDVVGQFAAKRALEIAAAGGHNMLMVGPPGAGKSMLASRIVSILPALSSEEVVELTKIYSALRVLSPFQLTQPDEQLVLERPFRAPHHTTSYAGLIGGGVLAAPGEISLAHRGVLFLDELPEFKRDVLESLRAPLETKRVTISRAKLRVEYPADFMLLAAMNPCPCGKRGTPQHNCLCSHVAIQRYMQKLSGPFLDRLDLRIWIPPVSLGELQNKALSDPTEEMRTRVRNARACQRERFRSALKTNSMMQTQELRKYCAIEKQASGLLEAANKRFGLSARGYSRILRVARTVADLEGDGALREEYVAEALSYRGLDLYQ